MYNFFYVNSGCVELFLHFRQKPLAGFCRGKRGGNREGMLPYSRLTFHIKKLRSLADFHKMRRKPGLFGHLNSSFLAKVN
jgi:hypothetical protein